MLNLAHGIAERGYAVDLVLAQAEGSYLPQVLDSVRVVDLGMGRIVDSSRTLTRLPSLVRYLRQERPDAMISALSRANLIAVWARQIARVPDRVVVNVQNTVSQDAPHSNTRLGRLAPRLARYFYRWADTVVGVSQGVVDDLVRNVGISQKLVKVVYNPGITRELREKAEAPLDHPWFRAGEVPVVLAVGRLMKQKDFPTLLKAFAMVRRSRRARLLILGDGPEREALQELAQVLSIEQDLCLPGFVENPYPHMKRASVFVLSSVWEGLPTVMTEALYCGAPIVATDCPSGPREILKGGDLGRLVPMRSPQALAAALEAALDGEVPRPSPQSWEPYTSETVVDQYVDLLFGTRESGT